MKYNRPWTGSAILAPRTTCGFFLNEYSAFLDIKWSYPMTMYHRDYKTVRHDDTDYIIKESDSNDCSDPNVVCQKNFYVTYGK